MEPLADSRGTRKFTVDEVLRMVEAGVLDGDEPFELLDGELRLVSPQGPAHAAGVTTAADVFRAAYHELAHVREEKPLAAGPRDLPEPDIAVVRGRPRDFGSRHPTGADTLLVLELSVSSHDVDREKRAVYARAGVPVYFQLDVPGRALHVHEGPRPDGTYRTTRVFSETDEVALPCVATTLRVGDLLP
jgi:Uma2 family endonuclease